MLNTEIAKKYAMAMFLLAKQEDKLVSITDELLLVEDIFNSFPDIMNFLTDPKITIAIKKNFMAEIFAKEIELNALVMNFLYLLIDKHRIVIIKEIVREFHKLSTKDRGILLAKVITAKALTKKQQKALIERLEAITNKNIELKTHTRKAILGGVIVQIEDKLIDGSVKGSLALLEKQLLAK